MISRFSLAELEHMVIVIHDARDKILIFFAGFLLSAAGAMIAYQFSIPHGLRYQPTTTEKSTMPTTPPPAKPVPINEQIAVVKRRLLQMENTYPRYVREHRMTQEKADKDLERFRAALDSLLHLKRLEDHVAKQQGGLPLGTGNEQAPYNAGGNDAKR